MIRHPRALSTPNILAPLTFRHAASSDQLPQSNGVRCHSCSSAECYQSDRRGWGTSAGDCSVCSHGVARYPGIDFIFGIGPYLVNQCPKRESMSIEEVTISNKWEMAAIVEMVE